MEQGCRGILVENFTITAHQLLQSTATNKQQYLMPVETVGHTELHTRAGVAKNDFGTHFADTC